MEPEPTDIAIGVRLRLRRLQLGLTQEALAAEAGCSHQQVQRYEQGLNRISVSAAAALAAAALGLSVSAIIGKPATKRTRPSPCRRPAMSPADASSPAPTYAPRLGALIV